MSELSPSRIVCSAARLSDGSIICSPRHCDQTHHRQVDQLPIGKRKQWNKAEQGFIDQHGVFFNRKEAHVIATKNNQIIRRCGGDEETLYSENLY